MVHACLASGQLPTTWSKGCGVDSLLGLARLAGQLLVDGGGVAEEGLLTGLQVDGDGDVIRVVHRPALDQLQAGLQRHAGRLEVKVRVAKRLVPCSWVVLRQGPSRGQKASRMVCTRPAAGRPPQSCTAAENEGPGGQTLDSAQQPSGALTPHVAARQQPPVLRFALLHTLGGHAVIQGKHTGASSALGPLPKQWSRTCMQWSW